MDIPVRTLRYFCAVARHGSLTAAARQMNVSQPSISAAVSQIEATLRVQLFIRRPSQGVRLTPDGTQVYEEARQLLAHVDAFNSAVDGVSSQLRGEVNLGCFINLAPMYMAGLLRGFANVYPQIEVRFSERNHRELLDDVWNGVLEMALSFDLHPGKDLITEVLATRPPCILVASDHPLAERKSVYLEELVSEPYVLMDLPLTSDYFLSLFEVAGLTPRVGYRTSSFEMVRSLVGAGLGYAILNLFPPSRRTYENDHLAIVPIASDVRPLKITLIRHPRLQPRPVARVLMEHIHSYFRESG